MITREEAQDMSDAHAEGWHSPPDGVKREGCPDCERKELSSYPTAQESQDLMSQAISNIEASINMALILFEPQKHPILRQTLLRMRGDLREAIGEART